MSLEAVLLLISFRMRVEGVVDSVLKLCSKASGLCKTADQLVLTTPCTNEKDINFKLTGAESVEDNFEGVTVWWSRSASSENATRGTKRGRGTFLRRGGRNGNESLRFLDPSGHTDARGSSDTMKFDLKMRKKDKQFVSTDYLDHVLSVAADFKHQQRDINLFGIQCGRWKGQSFKHPSTFDTLAMKPELKAEVKADLDAFQNSEKYFRRVGRPWKRGYLLYGPPGTGKSSMIAAIANYLKYDVYDLELTEVQSNDALKRLLRDTKSRSIIVIEDIDCSLDLAGKRDTEPNSSRSEGVRWRMRGGRSGGRSGGRGRGRGSGSGPRNVTLSGLLNSTDGLWSCCTDERIIMFTTNYVEKLDQALIRPGRMDMHIHMSYCNFESIKSLAYTYLSIESHPFYDTIRNLLNEGILITPAQVTEHLYANRSDPTAAMQSITAELEQLNDTALRPGVSEPS
nr:AAA-ATPase At5g57480-like [Physcomitrium patens]|eukprot:XP_024358897.1 AAA-ATPase At5g57480-like [Physcomitrella patens]